MNNEAMNETRLHPTWTKHCRMTIPSYTERFWTPCVYRRRRLIPASESAIHKNNKAPRLKSTKSWDLLNKSYCWQRAAPCVCVRVCAHVCQTSAGHISAVRESAGREDSYFCLKCIHHTTAEAKLQSHPSPRARSYNDLSCVSACLTLCVWGRRGECAWLHIEWFMVMT